MTTMAFTSVGESGITNLKIGAKWKELSAKTTNYQEARKTRQKALQDQEQGRLPNDLAKLRFEKAAELWLIDREKFVAPKTHRIDRERLVPLKAEFGHLRLCDIAEDSVRAYQIKRSGKVSPRTVNLETKVLRMMLRNAKVWARIADGFRPLPENRTGPGRALSPEQERKLFEIACSKPGWKVAYCVALIASNTSARGCELKGLRLRDVDLIEKVLRICRQNTKTDAGVRVVPLNESALWACARLLERAERSAVESPITS